MDLAAASIGVTSLVMIENRRPDWTSHASEMSVMESTTDIALVLEHSLEADVNPTFAWNFRTDIANWCDPPATFLLNGPFAEGCQGTTLLPGQEALTWWIRELQPGRTFAIEMPLDRATLRFEWHFGSISARRTMLTQRIILSGSNAAAYAQQIETAFGVTLADGMKKTAADMVAAETFAKATG